MSVPHDHQEFSGAVAPAASEQQSTLADPEHRAERTLIAAAARHVEDALTAWTENDNTRVALSAPAAVELLGKAVLWRTSPTLLVQLSDGAEASLLMLATKPDLEDPRLRTIGLAKVVSRLEKLLGGLPLEQERRKAMVDLRNGAIHVGMASQSRDVLLDALAMCRVLLLALEEDPAVFYGDHVRNAKELLDVKRTEVGHTVAAKLARARRHLGELEDRLGDELFQETTDRLEEQAEYDVRHDHYGFDVWGVARACPECGSRGRLIGRVEVDSHIEPIIEPVGHGRYAEVDYKFNGWLVTMFPQGYECNVCQLVLQGPEELAEVGLPSSRHDVEPAELGEGFDPSTFYL